MNNRIAMGGVLLAGVLLAAGCATSAGARLSEADALKARVDSLESQVAALNQRLEEASQQAPAETANFSSRSSAPSKAVKSRLTVRQVQKALAAAGYYKGPVDGKEGPQTKRAIKDFQQAQGLKADGVVGTKTSEALSRYLEEQKEV